MNQPGTHKPDFPQTQRSSGRYESTLPKPEATLRMIALAPPPAGLEERIQAHLRAEMRAGFRVEVPRARVLAWPSIQGTGKFRMGSNAWRTVAAAAIVAVVVGGGWGITSRVQPGSSSRGVVAPVRAVGPSGFSSAGAMRTPQTFNGPVIAPVNPAQSLSRNEAKNLTTRKAKSQKTATQKNGPTENQAPGQAK